METAELSIHDALAALRDCLAGVRTSLEPGEVAEVTRVCDTALAQLDHYLLPRVARPDESDAPLLVVVTGATGVGKSTLVNTLLGHSVSASGVVRPTTRTPVLVHHPDEALDELWSLPDVCFVADAAVPAGMAILDAPDVDTVVAEDRTVGARLLASADLWLFVTTAARYSDAVPWDLLTGAAARHMWVAVVLDRVAPEAVSEVRGHLAAMLSERGLGDAPLLVVGEGEPDESGVLAEPAGKQVRGWLDGIAADAESRTEAVRRGVQGAIDDVLRRVTDLADVADRLSESVTVLRDDVARAYGDARRRIEVSVGDAVMEPVTDELVAIVVEAADEAAAHVCRSWRERPAGTDLLDNELARSTPDLRGRSVASIWEWRREAAPDQASLSKRLEELLFAEESRFTERLDALAIDSDTGDTLRAAAVTVEHAREGAE